MEPSIIWAWAYYSRLNFEPDIHDFKIKTGRLLDASAFSTTGTSFNIFELVITETPHPNHITIYWIKTKHNPQKA